MDTHDEQSSNRICDMCETEFDTSDPHYYDEDEGVCYCSEECFKKWIKEYGE